jgi:ribosome modulation factor
MTRLLAVALMILAIAGQGCTKKHPTPPYTAKIHADIFQHGFRAAVEDVPATANPYQGKETGYAKVWLDGWMDGRKAR